MFQPRHLPPTLKKNKFNRLCHPDKRPHFSSYIARRLKRFKQSSPTNAAAKSKIAAVYMLFNNKTPATCCYFNSRASCQPWTDLWDYYQAWTNFFEEGDKNALTFPYKHLDTCIQNTSNIFLLNSALLIPPHFFFFSSRSGASETLSVSILVPWWPTTTAKTSIYHIFVIIHFNPLPSKPSSSIQ